MNVEQTADAFVIAREFEAPRELVFEVFTEPRHLAQWFAPKRFTVAHCTVDLRRGGVFHYCMRSPEGVDYWARGIFQEIVAPERIVYIDSFSDAQGNIVSPMTYGMSESHPTEMLVRITFDALGDRTRVTLRYEVPATVAERNDAMQGWMEMFERAAGHIEEMVLQAGEKRVAS